jgi:spermidine synthase
MLVAALWFLIWGRKPVLKAVALLALVVSAACGWTTESKGLLVGSRLEEVFRGNSNFGLLQIFQARAGGQRYLLNDYLMQGGYDAETQQSSLMFSYLLHDLAQAYTTNVADVLVIGLGIGLVPMQFAREGANVDAVEINPAMVPLARRYFNYQPERINLTLGDGRQFVNATRNRYDAIIVDAFLGDSAPSHLMTREAFTAMRRLLRPGGVLVFDCWGNFSPGKDFLVASLQKTLADVFPEVRIHCDINHQSVEKVINVFFVASPTTLKIQRPPTFTHVHPDCRAQVEAAFSQTAETDPEHGIILTDDYNPVDYYDASNREGERRRMAMRMKP